MLDIGKLLGIKSEMDSATVVKTDIYRYKRNTLASGLALLSLVFECLYFALFYSLHNGAYYGILIGGSVVLNLAVLLITFLSSEGVKVYNKKFCIPLLVIAAIQIARIFIYPMDIALGGDYLYPGTTYEITAWYFGTALSSAATSTILIIYLVLSAACLVASAIFGYVRAMQLEIFNKHLADGTFSVDAALADLNAKDAAGATASADTTAQEVDNA